MKNNERSNFSPLDGERTRTMQHFSASAERSFALVSPWPISKHQSPLSNHESVIETPRVEIGATDNPTRIVILSDRRESKDLSCQTNRRLGSLPQPSKFLIANRRLKFFVSHGRSISCKFLIANKSRFLSRNSPHRRPSNFPDRAAVRHSNQLKLSRYYVMVTLTFSRVG